MASGTARSFGSSPVLPSQGSYVRLRIGSRTVEGTILSRDGKGVVLSERSGNGVPREYTIPAEEVGPFSVKEIRTKPARKGSENLVDPYRTHTLQSEERSDEAQDDLDFVVKGYDAATDAFYVQGVLNGTTFGKWVSGSLAIGAIDPKTAGSKSRASLIKEVASAVGLEHHLAGKITKKTREEEKKTDTETTSETATKQEKKTTSNEEHDEGPSNDNDIPRSKPLKLVPSPETLDREEKDPVNTEGKRSTEEYLDARLEELRGKIEANDNTGTTPRSSDSAQTARDGIVLTDAALMSTEMLPSVIRQYAQADSGAALGIDATAWTLALKQADELSRQRDGRITEREQQLHLLQEIGAPAELLTQTQARIGNLGHAQTASLGLMDAARSRRSASELAALHTARSGSRSIPSSPTDARSIQSTLDGLRAGAGSQGSASGIRISVSGGGQPSGSSSGASMALPSIRLNGGAGELGFEKQTHAALLNGLRDLQARLAALSVKRAELEAQRQAALNDLDGATNEILNDLKRLNDEQAQLEEQLPRLEQAVADQGERVQSLEQALSEAPRTEPSDDVAPRIAEPNARTPLQMGMQEAPQAPFGVSGAPLPTDALVVPASVRGPKLGAPVPLSSAPLPGDGPLGRKTKGGTAVLGGSSGRKPGSIQTLRPLGDLQQFADLNSSQQQARRERDSSSGNPESRRAVTDVPQKRWARPDADDSETDDDAQDPRSMRDQVEEANQNLAQVTNNGEDADDGVPQGERDGNTEPQRDGSSENGAYGTQVGARNSESEKSAKELGSWLSSRGIDASQFSDEDLEKLANAIKKKKEDRAGWAAIEKNNKLLSLSMLSLSFAVVPLVRYIGNIYVSAVNRRAGFFSQMALPGYRPRLPDGIDIDKEEQRLNLALDLELFISFVGLFSLFILVIGVLAFLFFYYFGPVLAVVNAFCTIFSSACSH